MTSSSTMLSLLLATSIACAAAQVQEWSALRPWQKSNPNIQFVKSYPNTDGSGLNAQQAHMANMRSLLKLLRTYTGDDFSQIPEELLNEIPVSALLELDESVVATLPPSQFRRMHAYADDHAYFFIELIKMSSVDEVLRLPWSDMQGALPPTLYNQLSDEQLGAIPWEYFLGEVAPDTMATLDPRVLRSITPVAWEKATPEQIQALPPASLAALPISSFRRMPEGLISSLPCDTLLQFPADKLVAIGGDASQC